MELRATLDINEKGILSHYNGKHYGDGPGETSVEEVEEYVGDSRPFKKIHIPQLVEYHLLGEDEFIYTKID